MQEVTLFLAILLGVGFMLAKLVQLLRLPSVSGYILAGLLLGPSGLHLVTAEAIGAQLNHFTQMALMLIAFGIGEHPARQERQFSWRGRKLWRVFRGPAGGAVGGPVGGAGGCRVG